MAMILVSMMSGSVAAHEIPASVRINMFVKPTGDRLELVVRVPLAAMQ